MSWRAAVGLYLVVAIAIAACGDDGASSGIERQKDGGADVVTTCFGMCDGGMTASDTPPPPDADVRCGLDTTSSSIVPARDAATSNESPTALCDSDASVVISDEAVDVEIRWNEAPLRGFQTITGTLRFADGVTPHGAPVVVGMGTYAPAEVSAPLLENGHYVFSARWGSVEGGGYATRPLWKDATDFRISFAVDCANEGSASTRNVVAYAHFELCGDNIGYEWIASGDLCCTRPQVEVP